MIGLDHLGFAHKNYPWRKAVTMLPVGWALGVFDDPFGPVVNRIRWALLHADIPAVRFHSHYGKKGSGKTLIPLDKLEAKLPAYEAIAKEFSRTSIFVSHSCEYESLDKNAVQQRVNLIKRLAPSCIPVNSCYSGVTTQDAVTERHGKNTKARSGEIVSWDGDNCYDSDAAGWMSANSQAAIAFLWGYRFNLREINDPKQTVPPPNARTAAPSPTYVKSVTRVGFPKGTPPQVAGAQPMPKNHIYKTHGEDDQEPKETDPDDPRENRPVLMLPYHGSRIELLAINGVRLGYLIRFGSDFNGLARYYSGLPNGIGLYGVEIGEKAKKVSGSEWVCPKWNGKVFVPFHPAFRGGSFR